MSGSALVAGAAWHQPLLCLGVPTCSFSEPRSSAQEAIKGPFVVVLIRMSLWRCFGCMYWPFQVHSTCGDEADSYYISFATLRNMLRGSHAWLLHSVKLAHLSARNRVSATLCELSCVRNPTVCTCSGTSCHLSPHHSCLLTLWKHLALLFGVSFSFLCVFDRSDD